MSGTKVLINVCISIFVAVISYLYLKARAFANVTVRPALAKVSWWTALLSNHFIDWLVYHYPHVAAIISVIIGIFTFIFLLVLWR